jgi:hypothetical protein
VTPPSASPAATLALRFAALRTAAYRQYFILGMIATGLYALETRRREPVPTHRLTE